MDRETVIEMILDPGRRPAEGTPEHQEFLACLEKSPECREMYEQQEAVWQAMELWEPKEPSAGFDRALYARIERSQAGGLTGLWAWVGAWMGQPGEWLGALRPGLAAGLAALLLVAGGIVTYQPYSGGPGAEQRPVPRVESEYVEQIDQALDDIEMLADFEALVLQPEEPGRS